jgi:hypothetical protein
MIALTNSSSRLAACSNIHCLARRSAEPSHPHDLAQAQAQLLLLSERQGVAFAGEGHATSFHALLDDTNPPLATSLNELYPSRLFRLNLD